MGATSGFLYGTASAGGNVAACGRFGCGTVFSIDPNTGTLTTLYAFAGGANGQQPAASLLYADGLLYGTTELGGGTGCYGNGCGTVFSLDPNSGSV